MIAIFSLLTVVMFIFGLKLLQSPKTARRGNMLSALGMLIAIPVAASIKVIVDFTYPEKREAEHQTTAADPNAQKSDGAPVA